MRVEWMYVAFAELDVIWVQDVHGASEQAPRTSTSVRAFVAATISNV